MCLTLQHIIFASFYNERQKLDKNLIINSVRMENKQMFTVNSCGRGKVAAGVQRGDTQLNLCPKCKCSLLEYQE